MRKARLTVLLDEVDAEGSKRAEESVVVAAEGVGANLSTLC